MTRLQEIFLAWVIFILYRIFRFTWRVDEEPFEDSVQKRIDAGETVVFCHFHEDEWALIGCFMGRSMTVLVSKSSDGNIMTRFLKLLGYKVLRGSSSRGASSGFLSMLRQMRKDKSSYVSFAVDGPKGPRRIAKSGVYALARAQKSPIVCGAAYAQNAWIFRKSWSKAFLPKPFSKIAVRYNVIEVAALKEMGQEESLKNVSSELVATKVRAQNSLS